MPDFGTLPPEITSGRMYSGPGSGPLMAAASAWDSLGAQLESFSNGYSSATAGLQGESWAGPAAEAMAAAAAPYAQWAAHTGAQAEQAAIQARAASAAYETAHGAVVPPALVSANRTELANLVAANLLGQNTPQIATTESDYAGMWAQNTHTMFGYAQSSSTATQIPPFTQPPETTNPAGSAAQAAAASGSASSSGASQSSGLSQLLAQVPQQLQKLVTGGSSSSSMSDLFSGLGDSSLLEPIDNFNTVLGPAEIEWAAMRTVGSLGSFFINLSKLAPPPATPVPASAATGLSAGMADATPPATTVGAIDSTAAAGSAATGAPNAVLASAGEATSVGQLSVPQSWAEVTPVAVTSEEPLFLADGEPATTPEAAPMAGVGPMAGAAGAAAGAAAGRASVSSILRVGPRRFKMPRHSAGG